MRALRRQDHAAVNWFGNDNGGSGRRSLEDRLTRIETILELRMKQGEEFMAKFGAMESKLGTLHDDLVQIRSLPDRVTKLETHKSEMDALRNRAFGAAALVGAPVTGISVWSLFEHVGKLLK